MEQALKQALLEQALDSLCKATGRDIFIMLPANQDEVIPYLKKEIEKTSTNPNKKKVNLLFAVAISLVLLILVGVGIYFFAFPSEKLTFKNTQSHMCAL